MTPVIGSHSAEVWGSRPLKVSPRCRCGPRKPACQEQSRLLGPLQCKDTPTGQEGPRGSKGALKSWWCQLSFLSTTPTLRTSPGTFQTLTLQTLLSCREFYVIQTSLGVKRSQQPIRLSIAKAYNMVITASPKETQTHFCAYN